MLLLEKKIYIFLNIYIFSTLSRTFASMYCTATIILFSKPRSGCNGKKNKNNLLRAWYWRMRGQKTTLYIIIMPNFKKPETIFMRHAGERGERGPRVHIGQFFIFIIVRWVTHEQKSLRAPTCCSFFIVRNVCRMLQQRRLYLEAKLLWRFAPFFFGISPTMMMPIFYFYFFFLFYILKKSNFKYIQVESQRNSHVSRFYI